MADEPGWQQCLKAIEDSLPRSPLHQADSGFEKLARRHAQIIDLLAKGADNGGIPARIVSRVSSHPIDDFR